MTETVSVFTAFPLSDEDKERIRKVFARKHGEDVSFEFNIDKTVLGGILIIDGNDYYDSTVSGRLAKIKRNLQ